MQSLLHQLENNETILLMYHADELSAEDRAEVEQLLASDVSLRAELDRLRELHASAVVALGGTDMVARLPVSESVAVRRVTRRMRQWQIEHAHAPPPQAPANELRFPWWSYPLTTAAAVLIAFLVWWGNRSDPTQPPSSGYEAIAVVGPADLEEWEAELAGNWLIDSFDTTDEDFIKLAVNYPVDAGIDRLNFMAGSPDEVDSNSLNTTERNW